jgi:hypothetical protein
MPLGAVEPMAVRKLKQQMRDKKKLIIEGRDSELKDDSISLMVVRSTCKGLEASKLKTMMSEKKNKTA